MVITPSALAHLIKQTVNALRRKPSAEKRP
jgi:hypothetical protein